MTNLLRPCLLAVLALILAPTTGFAAAAVPASVGTGPEAVLARGLLLTAVITLAAAVVLVAGVALWVRHASSAEEPQPTSVHAA